MKILAIIFILLFPCTLYGQASDPLTAEQIVDSSIRFAGGENRIKALKSIDANYVLIQPDKSTAIINEKIRVGQKYVQSILSKSHVAQTTFFDAKTLSRVNGSSVIHFDSLTGIEEIRLKTYSYLPYGYRVLGYRLTRLPDKKFQNFDCYVIKAEAGNGYTTTNFFDKTNYRLLMVVYPGGNKSLLIDYSFQDSVLFNSHIVNTFVDSNEVQELRLQQVQPNKEIEDVWFKCPYHREVTVPPFIKTGRFESTNGPKTEFIRTDGWQEYRDETGKIILRRKLRWLNGDTCALMDEKAVQTNSSEEILVRIISWSNQGYVCQWISGNYTDTQDYRLKSN